MKARFLPTFLLCILTACVADSKNIRTVSSAREGALQWAQSYPTQIVIPSADEIGALERITHFFSRELNITATFKARNSLTNERVLVGQSSRFAYSIRIKPNKNETTEFNISCRPTSSVDNQAADYNAKNIARFIKEGVLEKELIQR